jgi:hypothetical protein
MITTRALLSVALLAAWFQPASAAEISSVLAQPIFGEVYACTEHWQGNLTGLGDELGIDCFIERMIEVNGRTWLRSYDNEGTQNEDWFGWNQAVLSPCACEVTKLAENPVINEPGISGKPPASYIVLKRSHGVFFLLAHIRSARVKVGEQVSAGQNIAVVGNNGYARHPHIHIGAWRGDEPLQIRFDLAAMGRLIEK